MLELAGSYFTAFWPFGQRYCLIVEKKRTMGEQVVKKKVF